MNRHLSKLATIRPRGNVQHLLKTCCFEILRKDNPTRQLGLNMKKLLPIAPDGEARVPWTESAPGPTALDSSAAKPRDSADRCGFRVRADEEELVGCGIDHNGEGPLVTR
jgi:hypothetical protein